MSKEKPVVYIVETDYSNIASAVEKIFQRYPLDLKDKLVWVKPNMLGNFHPNKHATTHPSLVAAVVKKLLSLNARVIVGDNSGMSSLLSEDKVGRQTGILEASSGTFSIISKEVTPMRLGGGLNETVSISKIATDCDLMISLPKMKTHLHTFLTGAIKNSYGMVVGVQKPNLHRKYPAMDNFAKVVAEVYNLRKPDLIIMDAVMVMEGDGPNAPNIRRAGRLIASTDGVAMDHCMARIMGMDVAMIPLLTYCVERGMGSADYEIEGNDHILEKFLLPKTYFEPRNRKYTFCEAILYNYVTKKRLRIDRDKCIRCLECAKICASKAIDVCDYPEINPDKCILCYCCKEICPQQAITFSLSYRIAQKMIFLWERLQNLFIKGERGCPLHGVKK
jgi:uncharacterized protein (DUF362 family)/NAD-dependent dihydropyrimidine dehydrogenase PreA subunit